MLSSFFLEIRTGVDYPPADYDAAAGRLAHMMVTVLSDAQTLNTLTHDAPRDACRTELEVSLEPCLAGRELVGKAVVDLHAPEKVGLDKSKLSKLLKARPEADEWPKMKIAKKAVPQA